MPALATERVPRTQVAPVIFEIGGTTYPTVVRETYREGGEERTAYRQVYISPNGNPYFTNYRGVSTRVTSSTTHYDLYVVDGGEYRRVPQGAATQTRDEVIRLVGGNVNEDNIQLVTWGPRYRYYGGCYNYYERFAPPIYYAPPMVMAPPVVVAPPVAYAPQPYYPQQYETLPYVEPVAPQYYAPPVQQYYPQPLYPQPYVGVAVGQPYVGVGVGFGRPFYQGACVTNWRFVVRGPRCWWR